MFNIIFSPYIGVLNPKKVCWPSCKHSSRVYNYGGLEIAAKYSGLNLIYLGKNCFKYKSCSQTKLIFPNFLYYLFVWLPNNRRQLFVM